MNFHRPLCSNPMVIFNRNAIYNLTTIGEYYVNGKRFMISPDMRMKYRDDFPFKKFSYYAHCSYVEKTINGVTKRIIDWDYLENSYCGYDRHGHKQYLFLAVPCGHCELCTEKKQNDFIARVGFENQTSSSRPMMVTLTYDPLYLPFVKDIPGHVLLRTFDKNEPIFTTYPDWEDVNFPLKDNTVGWTNLQLHARNVPYKKVGSRYIVTHPSYYGFYPTVLKEDVQKFLKRLRINWTRSGVSQDKPPLRYVCFSEYGSKYGRPHYHFIFWNVPYDIKSELDFTNIAKLKRDILSAWGMCSPHGCQCEVARDGAKYVSKYISKNMVNGKGQKCFRLASNRGGGIGALFLDKYKDFYRLYPSVQRIEYTDKWSGELRHSTFGQYAMNRIFPSPSKQIPDKYKQLVRHACYLLSRLGRVASALKEFKVVKWCDACTQSINDYMSILPLGYNPYVSFDPVSASLLNPPLFTDFIYYYDVTIEWLQQICSELDKIPRPDERDVLLLDDKRFLHNTLFERLDILDEQIESRSRSITARRVADEARELF